MPRTTVFAVLFVFTLFVIGCRAPVERALEPVSVSYQFLVERTNTCNGRFVPHDLDHITTINGDQVTMFDSNGAGLAVNDLDQDGDLDIVLANLAGPNAIFWNEGELTFSKEVLNHGQSRAVSIIDVDGDGWLDILFTRQWSGPTFWRNVEGSFEQIYLGDVTKQAYALNWDDFDEDGDIDLVTASYDAALEKDLGNSFMLGEGAGVYVYINQNGTFVPKRLANASQALAVFWYDVDKDGRSDILVGNDFAVPDQVWLRQDSGWEMVAPFTETTHSTMSFDSGDVNNDGLVEIVASDMKPYAEDPETLAKWAPVMDMMMHGEVEGDPQIMENVLQVRGPDNLFRNEAQSFGLAATGWSWSTKFGDLDNDGYLDLYVVNGMAAAELFGQLPGGELVEENQALRNDRGQGFLPAPEWGLNATEGGRGMSLADLDNDGDLDIVINNLLAPARIFENQLCQGEAVEVDLFWPDSGNTRALGAQVTLQTSQGAFQREVRANSGYLSGDPARLHFGLPQEAKLLEMEIEWPDEARSVVSTIAAGQYLKVIRTTLPIGLQEMRP